MNSFIKQLKLLLQESDKKQVEICKDLNIPKQKMSNWKSGYIEPNLDDIIMLAKYFNVSIDYLIDFQKD